MINIGKNTTSIQSDQNYRWTMEPLKVKQEGHGINIRTVVLNIKNVAAQMKTTPQYVMKYLARRLGTSTQARGGRFWLRGAHRAGELQDRLFGFIEAALLCPSCDKPDLKYTVLQRGMERICTACGWHGKCDLAGNALFKYMYRNPAGPVKTAEQRRKLKRRARRMKQAKRQRGQAAEEEEFKLEEWHCDEDATRMLQEREKEPARIFQLSFKPHALSPWGAVFDPRKPCHSWQISKVVEGQFAEQGVELGWRIRKVNGLDVTEANRDELCEILLKGKACDITFAKPLGAQWEGGVQIVAKTPAALLRRALNDPASSLSAQVGEFRRIECAHGLTDEIKAVEVVFRAACDTSSLEAFRRSLEKHRLFLGWFASAAGRAWGALLLARVGKAALDRGWLAHAAALLELLYDLGIGDEPLFAGPFADYLPSLPGGSDSHDAAKLRQAAEPFTDWIRKLESSDETAV